MKLQTFFLSLVLLAATTNEAVVNITQVKPLIKNRRMGPNPNYGTHAVPLITAVINTQGPILEMGGGDFSTPLLHALCAPTNRLLVTTESNKEWLELFCDLITEWHQFQYVPAYEKTENKNLMSGGRGEEWDFVGNDIHWSIVFIDHAPGSRRVVDIQRLRKNTDIFVVHDTELPSYRYERVLSTFKYRYTYERYEVQTTLVSDMVDVAQFFQD